MAKFVLLQALVAVVTIIDSSIAESNESISNSAFGYELIAASLDALNYNIESLKRSVDGIEKLVTKQVRHVSILEEEINKFLLPETRNLSQTCAKTSNRRSGLYRVQPQAGFSNAFEVYCDQEYNGGGWLVIQNRYDGTVNFFRGWKEYEAGFGDLRGEFWLGLKKLHELTYSKPHELHIVLEDYEGKVVTARYNRFIVGGAETKYVLSNLGNYSGNAGDSLTAHHLGMKFSTFDADNDKYTGTNCAEIRKGGWWYNSCAYRYFFSNVLQFQIHRAMCSASRQYDPLDPNKPLHKCDIYRQPAAGNILKQLMERGASEPWQQVLQEVIGEGRLDGTALREYFRPLEEWLRNENLRTNEFVGWIYDGDYCKHSIETANLQVFGGFYNGAVRPRLSVVLIFIGVYLFVRNRAY